VSGKTLQVLYDSVLQRRENVILPTVIFTSFIFGEGMEDNRFMAERFSFFSPFLSFCCLYFPVKKHFIWDPGRWETFFFSNPVLAVGTQMFNGQKKNFALERPLFPISGGRYLAEKRLGSTVSFAKSPTLSRGPQSLGSAK